VNATRHIVIAMSLTLLLFLIAGDSWADRIGAVRPVRIAPKVS